MIRRRLIALAAMVPLVAAVAVRGHAAELEPKLPDLTGIVKD